MMENKVLLQSSSDSTLCEFVDFNSKTTCFISVGLRV